MTPLMFEFSFTSGVRYPTLTLYASCPKPEICKSSRRPASSHEEYYVETNIGDLVALFVPRMSLLFVFFMCVWVCVCIHMWDIYIYIYVGYKITPHWLSCTWLTSHPWETPLHILPWKFWEFRLSNAVFSLPFLPASRQCSSSHLAF